MDLSVSLRENARRRRDYANFMPPKNSRNPMLLSVLLTVIILLVKGLCVQAASLYFTKEPKSQDALHGRSAMLRCEVSEPAGVTYSWLHDGEAVRDSDRRFQEGSNLKFTAVDRQHDGGNFQCVASTASGKEARSSNASFNIKWLESGGVSLQEPASEEEIESSAPVTLRCHIDGTPASAGPDHNGLYYCCAKNAVGQVCSSNNFTLNIIDKSFPRPVLSPEDQVVLKNDMAAFHCQFSADPAPTVQWYHDNELLNNKSRVFLLSNGTLLISQATLRLAEIDDMGPSLSRVFPVGTVQRVTCGAPWGLPEPVLWWERGGARVPLGGRVYQEGAELVFSPTEGRDSGSYTCIAHNKAGQRRQELTVTVATAPEWVTEPEDSHLEEGRPGYLHCHTRATPTPEITWLRNGVNINTEDGRFTQFPNGTLRINSVEVYDGAQFTCRSRTEGGALNGQARVYVLERLKFTPTPQPVQCLELEQDVSVQCSATGRQSPAILWVRTDGSEIAAHVEQKNGVMHFSKVTRGDAGNYTCVASNELQGAIRAMVYLTVAVYVVFRLEPENSTVYQGHTAMLHCQASGEPDPSIQWMVKDKVLDPGRSRFQKMPNGTLVIRDVTTEDTGKYTCTAGNSCNIRFSSAQLYVVEKPLQPTAEGEDRTPYKMIQTVGLSVGAAVAYIIMVLGLMFYCKKRRNAKRQRKGPEGTEPETERLNGGVVHRNGQMMVNIQEEVALANLGTTATANKRRGAFGEVLLAKAKGIVEDEEETLVLVKSLQTRDEQLQLGFRREVEMFGRLSHAHVVRLLGLCWEAEPQYMILEYVDLGDLKQFLRISKSKEKLKQPISTKQKVSICKQVAQGMEHLSSLHFVHRDLAARNCLISAQRRVKVSVLSLSKDVYSSEYYRHRQAKIPLRWLPAESVFADDFSTKTDVWSFGVLMWEVFSYGVLPYTDLSDQEVLEVLKEGKLNLAVPESCPSRVYKLMLRCWSLSPKERPSFTELVTALGELPASSRV
ncbi:hypothetical protein SKAU_G00179640 [Synaphobranchus kaupii]|uniref:Inactive tyrosine-protein kinase 7 n=1 Tax=Synaphobranchus kaupii TaxID=118154 RepID=A0A9Q1IZE0_SYNKA|nr:hypothetical protein SKAU_G00179640 [Synaphobranchus kaupii]